MTTHLATACDGTASVPPYVTGFGTCDFAVRPSVRGDRTGYTRHIAMLTEMSPRDLR